MLENGSLVVEQSKLLAWHMGMFLAHGRRGRALVVPTKAPNGQHFSVKLEKKNIQKAQVGYYKAGKTMKLQ